MLYMRIYTYCNDDAVAENMLASLFWYNSQRQWYTLLNIPSVEKSYFVVGLRLSSPLALL